MCVYCGVYVVTVFHFYIVLEINFEETHYYVTEGDSRLPTLRLQFRRTQNPFTMTLFSVTITEAIDPTGFNGSAFIPYFHYGATPGMAVEATLA